MPSSSACNEYVWLAARNSIYTYLTWCGQSGLVNLRAAPPGFIPTPYLSLSTRSLFSKGYRCQSKPWFKVFSDIAESLDEHWLYKLQLHLALRTPLGRSWHKPYQDPPRWRYKSMHFRSLRGFTPFPRCWIYHCWDSTSRSRKENLLWRILLPPRRQVALGCNLSRPGEGLGNRQRSVAWSLHIYSMSYAWSQEQYLCPQNNCPDLLQIRTNTFRWSCRQQLRVLLILRSIPKWVFT